MFIFGTRPEAIKLAPVIKKFSLDKAHFDIKICITAQHRKMLDEVLEIFSLKPDFDLNIMIENQTLYHITVESIQRLKKVLSKEKPDLVIVHGDTTTTFTAAMVAYYEKIRLAHIEAGLRSYHKYAPFPEEINRVIVDCISDILFAPTKLAKQNLLKEYACKNKIFVTGNTVVDAVKYISECCDKFVNSRIYNFVNNIISKAHRIILVTAHRRENFGLPLVNICMALNNIVKMFKDVTIVYPAHPNPNVQSVVKKYLLGKPQIYILPPLNYIDFVYLLKNSYLILTDSGGLQEEAATLQLPTLVLREVTERPEGVNTGILKIVGYNKNKIVSTTQEILSDEKIYKKMKYSKNPYGDGKSAQRILDFVKHYFGYTKTLPKEFSC